MTPADIWLPLYDAFYPRGTRVRDILERHSRSVAGEALDICDRLDLPLDRAQVETAAMLHDIGIFLTDAPSISCYGSRPYLTHGVLGANLLRRHGVDEAFARVAERHTGTGLYPDEIKAGGLDLPSGRIYYPVTLLEQVVCYADKFYSKSGNMMRKSIDRVRASLAKHGTAALERFDRMVVSFGSCD